MPVQTPATVKVDNKGIIFMSENVNSNHRTRHIHAKHRFLVDLTEEGFLDVIFTNSAKNISESLIKMWVVRSASTTLLISLPTNPLWRELFVFPHSHFNTWGGGVGVSFSLSL